MNKNIQIAFNVVFGIAIIILFYLQSSSKSSNELKEEEVEEVDSKVSKLEEGAFSSSFIKMRYINTDSLWSKYEYVKELSRDLDRQQENYRANLESKVLAFQKEINEFQQKAPTMSQFEAEQKQKALIEKNDELERLEQELSMKLLEMEDKMKRDLRKSILDYIDRYKNENIDLILDYSLTSSVLMMNDSLNITNEVLRGLNEEYQLKKDKK